MWIEVLLIVLIAPVLELLLTYVLDKIDFKWKRFTKEYDALQSNGDTDCFSMVMESETKSVLWVAIIGVGFLMAVGIGSSIGLLYDENEPNFTIVAFVIVNLMIHLICMPVFLIFLHHGTKKIYISKEQIVEKSLLIRTYIKIADISDVEEDIYIAGKSKGRWTTSDIVFIRSGKKKSRSPVFTAITEDLKIFS